MVGVDKEGSGTRRDLRKKAPNFGEKQTYLLNLPALHFFSSEAIFMLELSFTCSFIYI